MRLGIDAWGLSRDLLHTGMGQYTSHLLRQLAASAPHISVVAYAARGERRPDWLPASVEWRPLNYSVPDKLGAIYSCVCLLPRLARHDRLDLFHAPAVHMRPSLPPVPRLGRPTVVTLHDLIPVAFYGLSTLPLTWRTFYRWNLRRVMKADAVITVSQHARDEIIRGTRLAPERLSVVHNAVFFQPNHDQEPLHRLGICRPYILYAGSYEPRKNMGGALSAYALLVRAGSAHRLVAIVEPNSGHTPAIRALLDTLNLGDRVRLVHGLSDGDVRAVYTHADVLFFPSLAEGFGFPPVQAGACGVPAVVSDIGVLREILGDSVVYVNPGDKRSMADGLYRVLHDDTLRARLKSAGHAKATLRSGEEWGRRHVEIFERVLAQSRSR